MSEVALSFEAAKCAISGNTAHAEHTILHMPLVHAGILAICLISDVDSILANNTC
jgi:hypothetical protein